MSPVTAAILGALIGAAIVGLAWRVTVEHRSRVALAGRVTTLESERTAQDARLVVLEQEKAITDARAAGMEQELANLERVRRNKLYRESLEDVGFAASQAAIRIALMREDLAIVERILNREHKP